MHDTLLLFRPTGDLAARQLFPSSTHLLRDGLLPPESRVVAVARQPHDNDGFQAWLAAHLQTDEHDPDALAELQPRIDYVHVDLSDPAAIAPAPSGVASRRAPTRTGGARLERRGA